MLEFAAFELSVLTIGFGLGYAVREHISRRRHARALRREYMQWVA